MYKKITMGLMTIFSKIKSFFAKQNTEQTASLSGNDSQINQFSKIENKGNFYNGPYTINQYENPDVKASEKKALALKLETEIYQVVKSSHLNTEDSITAVEKKAFALMEDVHLLVSEISSLNGQYVSESLSKAISNANLGATKYLSARRRYIVYVKNGVDTDSQIQNKIMNLLDNAIKEFEEAYDDLNKFTYI